MKKYVLGFIFNEDEQGLIDVLLIRKLRPDQQADKLNGIGGKVEDNELPLHAMCRECKEETRLEFEPQDWVSYGKIRGTDFVIHLYYLVKQAIQFPLYNFSEGVTVRMAVDGISAYEGEFVNHTPACIMAAVAHYNTKNFNLFWDYDVCDDKTLDKSVKA